MSTSWPWISYLFVCLNENGITYLCLIDATFSKAKALGFLKDIRDEFTQKFSYDEIEKAISYGFDKAFGQVLEEKTVFEYHYYLIWERNRNSITILMKISLSNWKSSQRKQRRPWCKRWVIIFVIWNRTYL